MATRLPSLLAWAGWLICSVGVGLYDYRAGIAVAGALLWYDSIRAPQ